MKSVLLVLVKLYEYQIMYLRAGNTYVWYDRLGVFERRLWYSSWSLGRHRAPYKHQAKMAKLLHICFMSSTRRQHFAKLRCSDAFVWTCGRVRIRCLCVVCVCSVCSVCCYAVRQLHKITTTTLGKCLLTENRRPFGCIFSIKTAAWKHTAAVEESERERRKWVSGMHTCNNMWRYLLARVQRVRVWFCWRWLSVLCGAANCKHTPTL